MPTPTTSVETDTKGLSLKEIAELDIKEKEELLRQKLDRERDEYVESIGFGD